MSSLKRKMKKRWPAAGGIPGRPGSAGNAELFRQALAHHQAGLISEAERVYQQILRADPNHIDALCNLGIIYKDQGLLKEAAVCYNRALTIRGNDSDVLCNLGVLLAAQGMTAEAISHYKQALKLDPGNATIHNNLGDSLQKQGLLDEAAASFQQAITLAPDYVNAHNNLGAIFQMQGKLAEALACHGQAFSLMPENAGTCFNMAKVCNRLGRKQEAMDFLHRVLVLAPHHASAAHLLAALSGAGSTTAPPDYVAGLFDYYASSFDLHLVKELGYEIPIILRLAFEQIIPPGLIFKHGIDLGCGTGLAGEAFKPLVSRFIGMDLSRKMLEKAAAKNIYAQLHCQDIVEFLQGCPDRYDLFVATDVFVYIGDLALVFRAIRQCAAPGAFLVFSTEKNAVTDADYNLCPSGRYGHSEEYVVRLAAEYGFSVKLTRPENIRQEHGQWIKGNIHILSLGQC